MKILTQPRKGRDENLLQHIFSLPEGKADQSGKNEDELGPRFPDMSEPYCKALISIAEQVALENQIKVQKGVYVAVPGPNLETKAEYRFLRNIGADVVGMSTVPENITAVHMGMKVLGISIITDECFPESLKPISVEEVIATAMKAEPKMTLIIQLPACLRIKLSINSPLNHDISTLLGREMLK